jgi:hypothetical protein
LRQLDDAPPFVFIHSTTFISNAKLNGCRHHRCVDAVLRRDEHTPQSI